MVKKLVSRTAFATMIGVSNAAITKVCNGKLSGAVDGKWIDANHPSAIEYANRKKQNNAEPAAPGIDPLYEQAVEYCKKENRYSISGLQRYFKIGYNRAGRIVGMMKVGGLIPDDLVTRAVVQHPISHPTPAPPPNAHIRGTASAKEKKKLNTDDDEIIEIPENIQAFADMTLRELIDKFGTDYRFVDWLNATQKIEAINEKRLKNATTKGLLISRELVEVGVIDTFNAAHLRLMKDGAKSISAGVVSKHSAGAELSELEAYVSDILGSFIKPIKNKVVRVLKNA